MPRKAGATLIALATFFVLAGQMHAGELVQRLLYVASPDAAGGRGGKGIYVYDIDKGHKLVRKMELPLKGLRGICGSAAMGRLWISHGDTTVLCLDLATDKVLWEKMFDRKDGCDRLCCTPDGKKIYVPNGTWSGTGDWKVLSGAMGDEIGRFRAHKSGGGHNSVVRLDGARLYCASKNNNFLTVVDTASDKVIHEIGPVGGGIHPFSVNEAGTLCFLNTGRIGVGFEVGDLKTGKIVHEVKVPGLESQKRLCHGIGLSPDEKEVWVNDQGQVHIFDVSGDAPRFAETVKLTAPGHGWTTFSIDGRYAYPDSGDVFDLRTHKVVAQLTDRTDGGKGVASSKMIEVHLQAGKVVRIGDQFGLGRKLAPAGAKEFRDALHRALPLIEKGNAGHLEKRNCFACHHQAVPLLALTTARSRGFAIDEDLFQKNLKAIAGFLDKNRDNYRKGQGQGGQADTAGYALWTLQLGGWAPDDTTAAVAEYLLQRDAKQDHWKTTSNRPPSEVSPFTTTYVALRGLDVYAIAEQRDRLGERLEQVRAWLRKATPKETEDRVFRLRVLALSRAPGVELRAAADELLKVQRDDGGWNQKDAMESDAYATGSVLVALHHAAGVSTDHAAYRRGVRFLLQTQRSDGSWHVASRSKPFQLYYESGFPHGNDQFISMAGSSWAVTALALGLPPQK